MLLTGNTSHRVALLVRAASFKKFLGRPCPQPWFSYTLAELFAVMGKQAADANNVCVCEFNLQFNMQKNKTLMKLSLPVL